MSSSIPFLFLHLHIWCVDVESQIKVGLSIWNNLDESEKEDAMESTNEIRDQIRASSKQKSDLMLTGINF